VRYTFENAALYSGWKYILFANPSDAYPDGFIAIGNYPVPAGFVPRSKNSFILATTAAHPGSHGLRPVATARISSNAGLLVGRAQTEFACLARRSLAPVS
jgi:hypothetical protein